VRRRLLLGFRPHASGQWAGQPGVFEAAKSSYLTSCRVLSTHDLRRRCKSAKPLLRQSCLPAAQDKVPVPCTEEFMADVRAWEDVNEDEDEEAMKLQYYGITDIEGITGKVCNVGVIDQARGRLLSGLGCRVRVRPYQGEHAAAALRHHRHRRHH